MWEDTRPPCATSQTASSVLAMLIGSFSLAFQFCWSYKRLNAWKAGTPALGYGPSSKSKQGRWTCTRKLSFKKKGKALYNKIVRQLLGSAEVENKASHQKKTSFLYGWEHLNSQCITAFFAEGTSAIPQHGNSNGLNKRKASYVIFVLWAQHYLRKKWLKGQKCNLVQNIDIFSHLCAYIWKGTSCHVWSLRAIPHYFLPCWVWGQLLCTVTIRPQSCAKQYPRKCFSWTPWSCLPSIGQFNLTLSPLNSSNSKGLGQKKRIPRAFFYLQIPGDCIKDYMMRSTSKLHSYAFLLCNPFLYFLSLIFKNSFLPTACF